MARLRALLIKLSLLNVSLKVIEISITLEIEY